MSWQQQYLAYDQDSLATYANPGLVRRALKDLDAGKVQILQQSALQIVIESDGQQVILSASGLSQAGCSCPAAGACKHIVAAVLSVQKHLPEPDAAAQADADAAGSEAPPDNSAAQSSSSLLDEVLQLDLEQIAKQIGKAQREKALKLAQAYAHEANPQTEIAGGRLKIALEVFPEGIIYIAGAGFQGMLSEIEKDQAAWHLAALLALHQAHGKLWPALILPTPQAAAALTASEQQFIAELEQDLAQLLAQGLSHVQEWTARQFYLLNISAKSEGLPRLAAMLRQLSGQVRQLAQRDEHASEGAALISIAQLATYSYQLRHSRDERLIQLRGKIRQSYAADAELQQLELHPLGARWWRSQGGARGLTLYFWQPEKQQILEATAARAEAQDPGFDRYRAWSQMSLWRMTAQQLMQGIIRLETPRFAEDGRLAVSGASAAHPLSPLTQAHYLELLRHEAVSDWQRLVQDWKARLQNAQPLPAAVLLQIERFDAPQIDEIEQCVWWRLYDRQGQDISLRLDWKTEDLPKIRQLEKLCRQSEQSIDCVLAHVSIQGQQAVLAPVSAILKQDAGYTVFSLDFDHLAEKKKTLKEALAGRIEQLLAKKQQHSAARLQPPNLSQKVCEPILAVLETLSCSGRLHLTASQRSSLEAQRQLAEDAGLSVLAKALDAVLQPGQIAPRQLLALAYLCDSLIKMQVCFPLGAPAAA